MFFVDAAHFVFGTFLCCLWSFTRIFVRAASGRQRFNVLGAWNAVTHELIAVTNTTVVNTETMCELLRNIAAATLTGPITLVLDNARYQHNAAVQASAKQLGITLLFLPSYSPNLNLIERLWKFIKRRALYGRYHPTFADFQAAIQGTIASLSTTHAEQLNTLMTLNFQQFKDVSLYGRVRCRRITPEYGAKHGFRHHTSHSLGHQRAPHSPLADCAGDRFSDHGTFCTSCLKSFPAGERQRRLHARVPRCFVRFAHARERQGKGIARRTTIYRPK